MNENDPEIAPVVQDEAPAPARRSWKQPEVIVSRISDSEFGPATHPDGTNAS